MLKRFISLGTTVVLCAAMLTGCRSSSNAITVVSREDGSGTRGAFIELLGIEEKDSSGNKIDHTTESAEITNSTAVMLTTIQGNESAIGYISFGSLSDTVKALPIDGSTPTAENIKSGAYPVTRPFNIATKGEPNELAADFIRFICSAEGQAVVEQNGCVSESNSGAYAGSLPSGTLRIEGSSSVTPIMEKLKEAYIALGSTATIEIQQSDSTTGMTSVANGVCDIGMASRALKESELSAGLLPTAIAIDGIAIIVNQNNPVQALTSEQVKSIYTGETNDWNALS